MPNLTQKFIESLKPIDRMQTIPDAGMRGLELYVTKTGIKTFSVRYTLTDGTRRRMTLGRWPLLTLTDARAQTLDILSQVTKGKDPARTKQTLQAEARALVVKTITDLGAALLEASARKGVRPSTLTYWGWLIRKHINPRIGHFRTLEMNSKLVRPVLQEIGSEAGPVTSNRCLTVLKRMFNFAVEEELLEHNPLAAMKFAFKETSRDRVLTLTELSRLWAALERIISKSGETAPTSAHIGVSTSMALAIQTCLFTCQRGSEVAGMLWGEVDLDTLAWVIPAARTKAKRENLVPLSPQAATAISQAKFLAEARYGHPLGPGDAVFPSPRAKRLDVQSGLGSKIHPIERLSLNRAMSRVTAEAGIENATLHDLRRTGATLMCSEKIGTLEEIVARILNHSSSAPSVTGTYNRYGYVKEKRSALNGLGNLIENV